MANAQSLKDPSIQKINQNSYSGFLSFDLWADPQMSKAQRYNGKYAVLKEIYIYIYCPPTHTTQGLLQEGRWKTLRPRGKG